MRGWGTALLVIGSSLWIAAGPPPPPPPPPPAAEAPAGYDALSNGAESQGDYDLDRTSFDEREGAQDGLGPIYNAQSCGECHQTPISGGSSQITELRAGHFDGATFTEHPGGSVIQDRAVDPLAQEHLLQSDNVRALRLSLPVLGDGYVEAIPDGALLTVAAHQPLAMRGTAVQVPLLEAPGTTRVGRFGWKAQHASLLSFAADAYLNEMGVTSTLEPAENTSSGVSVAPFDETPEPEDVPTTQDPVGKDLAAFARFMRATKAPPRDAQLATSSQALAGSRLFARLQCSTCHVPDFTTAPAGTVLPGGLVVPAAIGGRLIHPFSDFLLHDVGTGDGVVQNGGPATRTMLRTPPLWGLRSRGRLMHDGTSFTIEDAVLRHAGQARGAADGYRALQPGERAQLLAFLASL